MKTIFGYVFLFCGILLVLPAVVVTDATASTSFAQCESRATDCDTHRCDAPKTYRLNLTVGTCECK